MNSDRSLKFKSLSIRRLDIALPCGQYRATASVSVSVAVAIRAVVTVVVTVTVAVIPVVVDADVAVAAVAAVGMCLSLIVREGRPSLNAKNLLPPTFDTCSSSDVQLVFICFLVGTFGHR